MVVIIDRIDEEFLLCALQEDGRFASSGRLHLADGVAAAWLADLLIDGKVRMEGSKLVAKRRPDRSDDAVEWALGQIASKHRPATSKYWLNRLSRQVQTHMVPTMRRLTGRGYVETVGAGRDVRYPIHNKGAVSSVRETLRQTLLGKIPAQESTVALLTVLEGAGLLDHLFGGGAGRESRPHMQKLLAQDHRFKSLSEAMHTPRLFRSLPW